jgi:hypothetical protein
VFQAIGRQAPHFVDLGMGLTLLPSSIQYRSIMALIDYD